MFKHFCHNHIFSSLSLLSCFSPFLSFSFHFFSFFLLSYSLALFSLSFCYSFFHAFSFNSFRFQISFPILDDLHLLFPYTMSTDRHFWSFSIVMYTYSIVYALQLSTSSFLPLSSCCRYHAQHNQCLILLSPPSCSRSKSSLC